MSAVFESKLVDFYSDSNMNTKSICFPHIGLTSNTEESTVQSYSFQDKMSKVKHEASIRQWSYASCHANSEFQQTDFEEKSLFFVHRKMQTFTQHLDSGFKDPYTICVVKSRVACYLGYVKKAGVYRKIKFGIRVKTRITNKYIL